MANSNTQLYASQGNGGRAAVTIGEIATIAGSSFVLPAPSASVRGGVLTQAGITPASATVPSAAPAGGTGAAEGAWDTAANRDAAIATINGLRTDVSELQTKVNALISSLQSGGIIA